MKLLNILLLGLLLAVTSCSSKKTETAESESEEVVQEDADFIVDAEDEDLIIDETELETGKEMVASAEENMEEVVESAPAIMSGTMGSYTVKRGETLMMIAFQLYGDYRKWKDLAELNGVDSTQLRSGMSLKYNQPQSAFVWNPDGLPYLIKVGDTLGTISNDKYGTAGKWRKIYNNNRPLIKDPNLIFAGFTLYYIPERELASE